MNNKDQFNRFKLKDLSNTLNINSLNTLFKLQKASKWTFKKQKTNICCAQKIYFKYSDNMQLKAKTGVHEVMKGQTIGRSAVR